MYSINFVSKLFRTGSIIALAAIVSGCEVNKPDDVLEAEKNIPEFVDYNYHVRPILSDKCMRCHGPQQDAEAGLHLSDPESAYAFLKESPGKKAIVPGNLGESEAYRRFISDDPEYQMPPPYSHLTLTATEKATLARWIEQGAVYKPHWAYLTPEKVTPPASQTTAPAGNAIDAFVTERLTKEGLVPSPDADKETIIRRLSFDLTGLPPTIEHIDNFLADDSDTAYDTLIDRLMESPAYGERMAAHWMDVARYADSDGYLDDKHRVVHPWRDWVIKAFNDNMPYDQFVTWQLAGDLMPDAGKDQILATAFNRMHKKNSEAGIDFEEFRSAYVADRTDTIGTAFLGLTVGCARCHDHKYDPISHKDYYELYAFFNSTNEIGTAVYGPDQTPGPSLMLTSDEQQENIKALEGYLETLETDYDTAFSSVDVATNISETTLDRGLRNALKAHYSFDNAKLTGEDGKGETYSAANLIDSGTPALLNQPVFAEGVSGKAFVVSDYNNARMGKDIGWYDRTDAFSVELWVKPAKVYGDVSLLLHTEDLRLGFNGYSLHLVDNKVKFLMAHSWPTNALQLTSDEALPADEWSQLILTYDGSSKSEGVEIYLNGEAMALNSEIDSLYKSILFEDNIHTYGFNGIMIGKRNKLTPMKDGAIDEIRVYDRTLTALEAKYRYSPDTLSSSPAPELVENHLKARHPDVQRQLGALKATRDELNDFTRNIDEIMVMGDMAEPRATHILNRGSFDSPTDQVYPSAPESILRFDDALPRNRLGLSKWLFDKKNPLTARVFVNRIWQMHFGRGLVATSDNFGNQGSLPSHPALLDWLSVSFVESGWDIKALHRMILTSSTYRQSSVIGETLATTDPENILLARGPSHRLDGEMIRDSALAASGLLVRKVGGPSQYPYQPAGLWDELTTKKWRYNYPEPSEVGDGLYRRSLYTIVKRTSPPPSMMLFDGSGRDQCVVQRGATNTPLQALVLLNDPQFVEASRVLAESITKTESSLDARLNAVYRTLLGRSPEADEISRLLTLYDAQFTRFASAPDDALALIGVGEKPYDPSLDSAQLAALTIVANAVMNTDASYTKR